MDYKTMNNQEIIAQMLKNIEYKIDPDLGICKTCGNQLINLKITEPDTAGEYHKYCIKCSSMVQFAKYYLLGYVWAKYKTAIEDENKNKDLLKRYRNNPINIVIYGKIGVGKTYLSFQMLREATVRHIENQLPASNIGFDYYTIMLPRISVFYIPELIADFKKVYKADDDIHFYHLKSLWYVFDGLGEELDKDTEYFEQIFSKVYNDNRHFIITTNLNKDELSKRYGERVISRLSESSKTLKLEGKDRRIQKEVKPIVK